MTTLTPSEIFALMLKIRTSDVSYCLRYFHIDDVYYKAPEYCGATMFIVVAKKTDVSTWLNETIMLLNNKIVPLLELKIVVDRSEGVKKLRFCNWTT